MTREATRALSLDLLCLGTLALVAAVVGVLVAPALGAWCARVIADPTTNLRGPILLADPAHPARLPGLGLAFALPVLGALVEDLVFRRATGWAPSIARVVAATAVCAALMAGYVAYRVHVIASYDAGTGPRPTITVGSLDLGICAWKAGGLVILVFAIAATRRRRRATP